MRDQDSRLLLEVGELLAAHYDTLALDQQDGPVQAFGRYLQACRECQEISIQELAQEAGVPQVEVLAYERGLLPPQSIKVESLQRLASALEEEIDSFLCLLQSSLVTPTEVGRRSPMLRWLTQSFSNVNKLTLRQVVFSLLFALLFLCVVIRLKQPWLWAPAQPAPKSGDAVSMAPGQSPMVGAAVDNPFPTGGASEGTAPLAIQETDRPATLYIRLPMGVITATVASITVTDMIYKVTVELSRPMATADETSQTHNKARQRPPSDRLLASLPLTNLMPPLLPVKSELMEITPPFNPPEPGSPGGAAAPSAAAASLPARATGSGEEANNAAAATMPFTGAMPIVHVISEDENLSCVAEHYYTTPSLYHLICLFNFGNLTCQGQIIKKGDRLSIPTWNDLATANEQMRQYLATINQYMDLQNLLGSANVGAFTSRRRGIDYFCLDSDYERFGAPLVAAGKALPSKFANQTGP